MNRATQTSSAPLRSQHTAQVEWTEHEHVSEPARAAAERLLESSGSAERAKHVIDVVEGQSVLPATPHHELANRAGFPSYLEMVAASVRIRPNDAWLIAPLPNGACMVFNEQSLQTEYFDARTAAENWIRQSAPASSAKGIDAAATPNAVTPIAGHFLAGRGLK